MESPATSDLRHETNIIATAKKVLVVSRTNLGFYRFLSFYTLTLSTILVVSMDRAAKWLEFKGLLLQLIRTVPDKLYQA